MHVGNEESNPKILFEKSRGLLCFWKNDDPLNLADRAEHYLIYRATDGITAHVGWSGGNLVLNGKTTKALDVSGITVTSDERLKNSFKSLDAFDDVFMDLDSVAFKYNNGTSGRFHFGFKAQNVRDSFLHHGFSTKDFGGFVQMSDSPNDEEYCGVEDPMGLIYTEFTAWNTHMIQKTIKENESLKSRISALEDKIELLLKQAAG